MTGFIDKNDHEFHGTESYSAINVIVPADQLMGELRPCLSIKVTHDKNWNLHGEGS